MYKYKVLLVGATLLAIILFQPFFSFRRITSWLQLKHEMRKEHFNCYCIKSNFPTSVRVQGDQTTVTA